MKKIGERLVESVLAGRRVSNYSTEWKEECEIAFLSSLKEPLLESTLVGAVGSSESIKAKRGAAEVERLRAGIARYRKLKAAVVVVAEARV
ncbi:MAG: hypothetical protein DI537_17590 [Stutzerimonas stutzeri]|nr:MAG: hypothetical protein DI537_17590 [Stutzerimonas stutzeri]